LWEGETARPVMSNCAGVREHIAVTKTKQPPPEKRGQPLPVQAPKEKSASLRHKGKEINLETANA